MLFHLGRYIKMQSLFESEDDSKYSFEAVKDFIGESFNELRKVYKAYGAMGGGSTMSMTEFLAMIRDCKLIDKNFTSQDVDLVFIKTNIEIDEITGERVEIALNPNKALTTTEFVEAIVRVAHGTYLSSSSLQLSKKKRFLTAIIEQGFTKIN